MSKSRTTLIYRATAIAAAGTFATSALVAGVSPATAGEVTISSTQNAAGWLTSQNVGTDGGALTSSIIGLTSAGYGKNKSKKLLKTLRSNVKAYISGDGAAGALGKSIYAVQIQGANPRKFGGQNLVAKLNKLMVKSGASRGRFQVNSNDWSSGFTQAWGVIGLGRASKKVPVDAIKYLMRLQCSNGGFAAAYNPGAPSKCTSNSQADYDTTAMAVQALLTPNVVRSYRKSSASAKKGVNFLVKRQKKNGSFDSPPWSPSNSNTTGLAAQALRVGGKNKQAAKASKWIRTVQLTCRNTAGKPSRKDRGAIAYDVDAFKLGRASGLNAMARPGWLNATQQAITGMSGSKPLTIASYKTQKSGAARIKC